MAVEDLNDENFEARLSATSAAVVDFYAGWCGPCMMFKPKFKRLSEKYPHVSFFVCDGEAAPESRKTVQIDSLPYFGFYKDGQFVSGLTTTKEAGFSEELEKHFGPGE
ncbi:MAG: thioredoxin family protein [Sandaracinaceae bacterium]